MTDGQTPHDAEWLEYDDDTRPVKKPSTANVKLGFTSADPQTNAAVANAAWVKHVQTIRRVLMGQWANNDARLKALAALHELEKELVERG